MTLHANWSYPTQIRFGAGRISEIDDACRDVGIRKPLLVTDAGLARFPAITTLLQRLSAAGLTGKLFAGGAPNPSEVQLAAGIEAFTAGQHDGVIAIGGGSSLDLGKLIAFQAGQTRPVWDFEDRYDWWQRADSEAIKPIIAIPTTAGTGSEVGRAGVLLDSQQQVKKIIFHPGILPSVVICDPELTVSMPPEITLGTGLDACIHCLEAYCSPFYHPMSQGIALEGIRLVKEYLPRAMADGNDLEARAHMMSAAAMGAVAFQKGLGAIHALSHPVSALYNTHHGMTNAVITPYVLRFNRPVVEQKLAAAAAYLGIDGDFNGFYQYMVWHCAELGVPTRLSALGVDDDQIERLAEMAVADPSAAGNPRKLTLEDARQLYQQCL